MQWAGNLIKSASCHVVCLLPPSLCHLPTISTNAAVLLIGEWMRAVGWQKTTPSSSTLSSETAERSSSLVLFDALFSWVIRTAQIHLLLVHPTTKGALHLLWPFRPSVCCCLFSLASAHPVCLNKLPENEEEEMDDDPPVFCSSSSLSCLVIPLSNQQVKRRYAAAILMAGHAH